MPDLSLILYSQVIPTSLLFLKHSKNWLYERFRAWCFHCVGSTSLDICPMHLSFHSGPWSNPTNSLISRVSRSFTFYHLIRGLCLLLLLFIAFVSIEITTHTHTHCAVIVFSFTSRYLPRGRTHRLPPAPLWQHCLEDRCSRKHLLSEPW